MVDRKVFCDSSFFFIHCSKVVKHVWRLLNTNALTLMLCEHRYTLAKLWCNRFVTNTEKTSTLTEEKTKFLNT
jgi:hypothetical protein